MVNQETLDKFLKVGVDNGASDIHFEVGTPPCYRIKGELIRAKYPPLTDEDTLQIARIFLGPSSDLELDRAFPEQDTSYSLSGLSRFRASIFRQRSHVGLVLRVVPFEIQSFKALHLPPVVQEIAAARRGLILVTGATGMGKSTTIAAMLQHLNETRRCHILTVEDPIEFLFEGRQAVVVQRQVGSDTQSHEQAMISALRQDPDVIMLGEVRDANTAGPCLKAAETGHLVITTLHTPDVRSTLKRFTGFFPAAEARDHLAVLAETLQAVISLRLVPTADGSSVLPAVEILRVTHTLQACIRDPGKHDELLQHMANGRELYGMQTFDQHLIELINQKKVNLETAKLWATQPEDLERALMVD